MITSVTLDDDHLTVTVKVNDFMLTKEYPVDMNPMDIAANIFSHLQQNLNLDQLKRIQTAIGINKLLTDTIFYKVW